MSASMIEMNANVKRLADKLEGGTAATATARARRGSDLEAIREADQPAAAPEP